MPEQAPTLGDDLLTGAQNIGEFIGVNPRRAFYLLERGLIPGFKLGAKWCALKSRLRAHFSQLDENGGAADDRAAQV